MSLDYKTELEKLLSAVEHMTENFRQLLQPQPSPQEDLDTACQTQENSTVEQPNKETTDLLPAWCKKGQWVRCPDPNGNGCSYIIGKIEDVSYISSEQHFLVYGTATLRVTPQSTLTANLNTLEPISFRPYYTYEEAEKIVGKKMKCLERDNHQGFLKKTSLVTSVQEKRPQGIFINGENFHYLARHLNATIDGVPIGVPEVDEYVMKKTGRP